MPAENGALTAALSASKTCQAAEDGGSYRKCGSMGRLVRHSSKRPYACRDSSRR